LIRIALGTKNNPKIRACKSVLEKLSRYFPDGGNYHINTCSGTSNVSAMPLSLDEMMRGAKNRAVSAYNDMTGDELKPDYGIGMEGGFFVKYLTEENSSIPFLQSWAYVYNGHTGHWGSSGAIQVPAVVSVPVLEKQIELAEVIDRISGQTDIRSGSGAVGVFTRGEVVRQDLFYQALIFAFSPFFNHLYTDGQN
jgi:inosine/xanthosine triphosphatase